MNEKPQFGIINPQPYMAHAIERLNHRFGLHEIKAQGWQAAEIRAICEDCRARGIRAVGGFAQKDAFQHLLINGELGNPVPSRIAFFHCMNKYLMRTLERRPFFFAPVDPMHESDDAIVARIPDDEWPFMLKNTSLSLGRGIFKISDAQKLRHELALYREDWELQNLIASQTASWLDGVDRDTLPQLAPPFIAEHYVDINQCTEYCYEGYVTPDGRIVHYALTEEIYFSDHQALGYLTPSMSISTESANRIEAWVEEYMGELVALGYRNQFFNLEFWVMPDGSINLTEINPRAAHSYHYNYLYSFGNELYGDNLLLASGQTPSAETPWSKWRRGEHHAYTLIVLITGKESGRVADILDYDYVAHLEQEEGVLIRHNKRPEDAIRDSDLTAAGVMLLQLWITAATLPELIQRERTIRGRIYRNPQSDIEYPDYWR